MHLRFLPTQATQAVRLLVVVMVLVAGCSRPEQKAATEPPVLRPSTPSSRAIPARPVPPFHESAEAVRQVAKPLPAETFRKDPPAVKAYAIAASIPEVLVQLPCYCWCDKLGHGSLLECFASDHGAG